MFDLIKKHGRPVFASRDAVIYLFNSFRYLGINPPNKYRIPYFFYSFITCFIVLFSPVISNVGWLRDRNKLSVMEILTCVQASLNVLAIPIKSIALAMSKNRLRDIEPIVTELDKYYTRSEDRGKIRKCGITGNRLVFGFAVAYFTYEILTVVAALVGGHAPISFWIPNVDWHRSSWEYWLQVSYDIFIVLLLLYHQVLNDSYPAVYIYIIRTHIQLLAVRVERLGYDEKKSVDDNYKELLECIVIHQEILKVASIVEPIMSVTVFTQFIVAAAILGVTMINIFIFADLTTKIASTMYFFCVLLQTSPTCYHASYLLADCDELRLAIFKCNWVDQNKRFNNLLIYFLHRSQDSIPLFAMKLVPINLATNLSIAKFSFTLFTFIQEMGLGENLKVSTIKKSAPSSFCNKSCKGNTLCFSE
ncbi:odorant receptor 7a-like [Anastrepha obliqua]|uniref:odorant receptor 7a-like n=1 Tax=Anastrepha obliqua TaxID=95512 RepID=UPI002409FA1A|nr:odorant receptor 7a-like [Anastrepha obliqua]